MTDWDATDDELIVEFSKLMRESLRLSYSAWDVVRRPEIAGINDAAQAIVNRIREDYDPDGPGYAHGYDAGWSAGFDAGYVSGDRQRKRDEEDGRIAPNATPRLRIGPMRRFILHWAGIVRRAS